MVVALFEACEEAGRGETVSVEAMVVMSVGDGVAVGEESIEVWIVELGGLEASVDDSRVETAAVERVVEVIIVSWAEVSVV